MESVAGEQQVALELRQLVIPIRVAPAAILDLADSARILHDTINGHVLRCDDPAHGNPPCCVLVRPSRACRYVRSSYDAPGTISCATSAQLWSTMPGRIRPARAGEDGSPAPAGKCRARTCCPATDARGPAEGPHGSEVIRCDPFVPPDSRPS